MADPISAEDRAKEIVAYLGGTKRIEPLARDALEFIQSSIRSAEQAARQAALEEAANVVDDKHEELGISGGAAIFLIASIRARARG